MYTVIYASKDQVDKLFEKHLKPGFLGIKKVIFKSYEYDDDDGIGFVTLQTITGKRVSYQLRGERPCFVEVTGFGSIRYDISYPEVFNQDLFNTLKEYGINAKNNFWKGGKI